MKCPKCSKEMVVTNKDTSHNNKTKAIYSRTLYHCEKDDIWLKLEVPKQK